MEGQGDLPKPSGCCRRAVKCSSPGAITSEAVCEFHSRGYSVIKGAFDKPSIEAILHSVERLIEQDLDDTTIRQYDDVSRPATLKQMQQLWKHDAFFARLMERLRPIAEAALGEKCIPQVQHR